MQSDVILDVCVTWLCTQARASWPGSTPLAFASWSTFSTSLMFCTGMTAVHHHACTLLNLPGSGCRAQPCNLVNVTSHSDQSSHTMVQQRSLSLVEMKATAHARSKAALQCCMSHGQGICCA